MVFACGEEPERITPSMKTQIDTTFRNMTKALKIEMDSICDAEFDKQVKIAKDSIMIERLEERKKKLGY